MIFPHVFSVCLSAVFSDDSHDSAREKELLLEIMLTEKVQSTREQCTTIIANDGH